MAKSDAEVLMLFKRCLDLDLDEREAVLSERPDLADAVRQLLHADDTSHPVEDGFGLGAMNLLASSELAEADAILPTAIGPYRVLRVAGSGATAIVYEAMEAMPRRTLAVKVARATLDPSQYRRFIAEAEALSQIRHQAIPVIFRVGEMAGLPWLAMEWVEGTPLAEDPSSWTLEELALVADGLDAAHQVGVFHGDISPSNLLHTPSGPKIVDFGHSGSAEDTVPTGGTPGFMPPPGAAPAHRDQYALAQIIAVCMPQRSRDLDAVVTAAREGHYDLLSSLAADLRAVASDTPVSVLPSSVVEGLRRTFRRHRRSWVAGVGGLALVGALVLTAWQVQARQQAAAQLRHYDEASADLDVVLAGTAGTDRLEALKDWLADPRWAGTPAVSRAWLEQAVVLEGTTGLAAATEAAGRALVQAKSPEQTRRAAEVLSRLFTVQGRWSSLERLAEQVNSPQAQKWRWRTAVAHRRLADAAALSEDGPSTALLEQWQQATRTDHHAAVAQAMSNGLVLVDQMAGNMAWVDPRPDLPTRNTLPISSTHASMLYDRGTVAEHQADGRWTLSQLSNEGGPLQRTVVTTSDSVILAATHLDGDAHERVLLGTGPPARVMAWSDHPTEPAHPATDAAASDVNDLIHVRLADGSERVVAAMGPWTAYDLRLFAAQDGELALLDRVEMGVVDGMRAFQHGDEHYILAPKSDAYPNRAALGEETPTGRAFGLYQFRVTRERLEEVRFIPLDTIIPTTAALIGVWPGDLDGDGDVDFAVQAGVPGISKTVVVVTQGNTYDVLLLDDIVPLAVVNVDDDPAQELIVRVNDDEYTTWVLGAGTNTLPTQPSAAPTTDLSGQPREARALAQLGLDRAAALSAEALAARSTPKERADLLLAASQSWMRFGDVERAAQAMRTALTHAPSPPTLLAIRDALYALEVDQLHYREALEVAELVAEPVRGEPIDPEAMPPRWHLSSELTEWTLGAVDAIRTPVRPDGLALDVVTGAGDIATADLDWQHTDLILSYTVEVSRLELGSGLGVDVLMNGEPWIRTTVVAQGGSQDISVVANCAVQQGDITDIRPVDSPVDASEVIRISVQLRSKTGAMTCQFHRDGQLVRTGTIFTDAPDDAKLGLRIRTSPITTDGGTRGVLTLRDLEVRGAALVAAQHDALHYAHAALLRGEYADAAHQYHALARHDLAALARLQGGDAEAAMWFADHPDHPLTRRLHRSHSEVGRALADADPDGYAERVVRSLGSAARYTSEPDVRALLLHPSLADLAPDEPENCDVLHMRARVYADDGRLGAALAALDRIRAASPSPANERCMVDATIEAARLLAIAGRLDDARTRVHTAIGRSATPELVSERLARRPELQAVFSP